MKSFELCEITNIKRKVPGGLLVGVCAREKETRQTVPVYLYHAMMIKACDRLYSDRLCSGNIIDYPQLLFCEESSSPPT